MCVKTVSSCGKVTEAISNVHLKESNSGNIISAIFHPWIKRFISTFSVMIRVEKNFLGHLEFQASDGMGDKAQLTSQIFECL